MQIVRLSVLLATALACQTAETVWLHTLDLTQWKQGYGTPQINCGIREKPLSIGGQGFEHGVGNLAKSSL